MKSFAASIILTISLYTTAQTRRPDWFLSMAQQPTAAVRSEETKSSEAFEALRKAGFSYLYNIEYDKAKDKFEEMIKLNPEHPAGHYYLATTKWLSILNSMRRLQIGLYTDDSFFTGGADKVDPQIDHEFRSLTANAIIAARRRLNQNEKDLDGLYFLGATYGMLASYEASVARSFKSALNNGSRGVKIHRDLIKLDPNYADAYLSIGLYNYVVGTLPWLIRWGLKITKVSGNRQRGLEEIHKAVRFGKYASDDARIVLITIYQREEEYGEALKLLEELVSKYPQNYLHRLERAAVLGRMGKNCESYAAFDQVLKDVRTQPIADLIHYRYGEALFYGGELSRAVEQFVAVTETPAADSVLISLAHLRQGQSLDAVEQRQAALEQYKIVLKRDEVFDSHSLARRYNRRPYAQGNTHQEKCEPGR